MKTASVVKMVVAGAVLCIGGPLLTRSVMPDPDELFERYSPELKARVLAERDQKRKEQQAFLDSLKEHMKDRDRPIWVVAKEAKEREERERQEKLRVEREEKERVREEIARERLGK